MAKTIIGVILTILGVAVVNFGLYQNIPLVISHPDGSNASCSAGIESINEGACGQTHSEKISPIGAAYYVSAIVGVIVGLTMVTQGRSRHNRNIVRRIK